MGVIPKAVTNKFIGPLCCLAVKQVLENYWEIAPKNFLRNRLLKMDLNYNFGFPVLK